MAIVKVKLISLEVITTANEPNGPLNGADADRITLRILGFDGPKYQDTYHARPRDKFEYALTSGEAFKEAVVAEAPIEISLSREDNEAGFQSFGVLSVERSIAYGPAWGVVHDFEGKLDVYWPPRPYHYRLVYDVSGVAEQ